MKDPVSGTFRVSGYYDAYPHSNPSGTRLTGVIIVDGLAPTPADALADHHGKWVGHDELPVTVDRTHPNSPARRAAIATVGTTLPLLVDPDDPGRLSIDVGRMNLP